MRRIYYLPVVAVSISVSSLFASAVTPTPSVDPNNGLAVKQLIENGGAQFQMNLDNARTQLENTIRQKRAALEVKLSKIVNEAKRVAVKQIDEQMDQLNAKMTDHFSNVLDHLKNILTKISDRADKAEVKGYDVSAARMAISAASQAIAIAHTAVTAQASKTYIMQITIDANLKKDVGNARQNLHNDLENVRTTVKDAFAAVQNAAVTLGQLKIKSTESPAASPNPSASQ